MSAEKAAERGGEHGGEPSAERAGERATAVADSPAARLQALFEGHRLTPTQRRIAHSMVRRAADVPFLSSVELAEAVLDEDQADRPLTRDVMAAAGLLDRFTEIWRGNGV